MLPLILLLSLLSGWAGRLYLGSSKMAVLEAARTVKGRKALAAKTGISEQQLLEWANVSDYMRIPGMGKAKVGLVRAAGVTTVRELALRNPARLAQNMTREDIPAGAGVVVEGEEGDRFYVVLSGMLAVSQRSRGAQSVLRPGDYFGEVALAMDIPRTATVRALTPVTVASCDRETFDEYIRPLFADET